MTIRMIIASLLRKRAARVSNAGSFYLRPDGVSFYLRPDGTSKYERP